MVFRIELAQAALLDAQEYVERIAYVNRQPEAAVRWYRGLMSAVYSLEHSPERCALIPEHKAFPYEARHLIYFSHRIIFRIDHENRRISISRFFHGKRRLRPSDIED